MRVNSRIWALVLSLAAIPAGFRAQGAAESAPEALPPSAAVDVKGYRSRLAAFQSELDSLKQNPDLASQVLDSVPSEITITEKTKTFRVSLQWLRNALLEYKRAQEDSRKDILFSEMQTRLKALAGHAAAFEAAADPSVSSAKLREVLQRREFSHVGGQSWKEGAKDALLRLFMAVFGRLFSGLTRHPELGRWLLWSLIAAAVSLLALLVKRLIFRRAAQEVQLSDQMLQPSAKSWQRWLQEAKAAADRSQLREAIRLAYWAGISYLESTGAWPPDRARTPREYLALLPAQSNRRPALKDLTLQFELAWYANQGVTAEDFHSTLNKLEQLGCPAA